MPKRVPLLIQFGIWLICAAIPGARAQGEKPSQALRKVAEQRQKLFETFQRDAERLKERSSSSAAPAPTTASSTGSAPDSPNLANLEGPDQDKVNEALIKFAAERAAGFKIEDWKGEELRMLGELYQTAEQFAQASAAFRAYFKEASNSQSRMRSNARAMLIFSLIETEQYDEAEKWLEGGEWIVGKNADETADRIEAYLNLASVLHESGRYDKVATLAGKGYEMASSFLSRNRFPFLVVRVERNQPVLAALAVAANERIGRKKEADDLNKLALDSNLSRQPELRSVYETTLAAARLIGTPAPEIEVSRWIEGKRGAPKSLSELRGNVTLLNFWAIWSEPYANTSARLRSLQSKYDGKGLEMIGVTKFYGRSDTEGSLSREQEFKSLQNYHDRLQLKYPFAIGRMDDVTNEERYGVASVPTMILIDRRGVARHIIRGIGEYRHFEKQIEKLINEK